MRRSANANHQHAIAIPQACFELPITSVLTVRTGLIVRDASNFDATP